LATIAIKGKTSSSKSLFPKLSKHACLIAKECRKKIKSSTSSSIKYVTSDEDTLSSDNYDSSDNDKPLPSCDRTPLKKQGFVSQDPTGGFSMKQECTNTHT
jgi:hypothetical protein